MANIFNKKSRRGEKREQRAESRERERIAHYAVGLIIDFANANANAKCEE